MCPVSAPVLCMYPAQRLGLRWAPLLLPSDDQDIAGAIFRPAPQKASSHTEPFRTTLRLNQVRNPRQHPKIAVLRLPPGGPALHPRPRSARPRPLLGPPFRRKNEFAVGTQGKPVKALSPNCRGGSFTGRRQTAATPHAPPSGRAAGIRTEPAGAQPPHSCERLTRL